MCAEINSNRRTCQCRFGTAALMLAALQLSVIGSARAGSDKTALMKVVEEQQMASGAVHLPVEGQLPSLSKAGEWLNSKPLTSVDLRGKVVLIDFWTYSCINWRRQLPYVRAWDEKYKAHGLVVIGVHAPEFSFEKNLDNVRQATKDMRIGYPIVIDYDYAIWRAFNNEYWPALYFVDAKGRIRHHQFGEGEYQESEIILQQLLAEAGTGGLDHEVVSVDPRVLRPLPIGAICGRQKTMSDMSAPRTLRLQAVQDRTSVTTMLRPRDSDSIIGLSQVIG